MSDTFRPKIRRREYARRRRTRSLPIRVARTGAKSRLSDVLASIRDEDPFQGSSVRSGAKLLEGVEDAIQRLIDAIDRFQGDPDEEPEQDVGADDLGEPED